MTYFDHFADSPITPLGSLLVHLTMRQEFGIICRCLRDRQCAILEIGAGRGELARMFADAGFRDYTAVEPNPKMRDLLTTAGFKTASYVIPTIAEADGSFDAIVLKDVFEHLNGTTEARHFIAECQRILRPKGLVCISSPDYLHWRDDFFNSDYSHSNITSARRARQVLQDGGFRTVRCEYLSGFLRGYAATIMSYAIRLGLAWLHSDQSESHLYKLKLTFLRQFVIIGEKSAATGVHESA